MTPTKTKLRPSTAPVTPTLGSRVARLRRAKMLNQHDAGRLVGISPVSISRFERGETNPGVLTVLGWLQAWGFTRDEAAHALLSGWPEPDDA